MYDHIKNILDTSQRIVVIQADNPDADSLGSALALEQLLEEMGKHVYMYCAVQMPEYLHYLEGWDRVLDTVPSNFDASIIVDTTAISLLQKLTDSGHQGWVASKPCIVLDHHGESENDINFADVVINDSTVSSTGELLYAVASELTWPLDAISARCIMAAILGDTQGLTNDLTSATTYRVMAALTELGANRPELEELRREAGKMDPRIFAYKAELIKRTAFESDGRLAIVTIPQVEINTYSPLYNPAPLIQTDMLQTQGVLVSVVLKHYDDGKILASIRTNHLAPIANTLAVHFGGGGHPHAAGFKLLDGRPINEVKSECISVVTDLLNNATQPKDT